MENKNNTSEENKTLRQLFFDTETTGFKTKEGHRIVEIGMVEVIDGELTGNNFHYYLNPERDLDKGAVAIHGLTLDFLKDKPKFKDITSELVDFIEGAELVAHNAPFDMEFLEYELNKAGLQKTVWEICDGVIDTLDFAKKAYPGKQNNLDKLAERLGIDNSHRTLHGALLDSEILVDVFNKMIEQNPNISLRNDIFEKDIPREPIVKLNSKPQLRTIKASLDDVETHQNFFQSPEGEKKVKARP